MEKTYVAVVAHEGVRVGQLVTVEETPRMEALLGAGYYFVKNTAYPIVDQEFAALEAEDDGADKALLERDEEQDMVEKPKRPNPPRRTRVQ